MSSLPRMLLRYCQSVIIALALCLSPEAGAGFAQSTGDLASDLELSDAQELLLSNEVYLADIHLADSFLPESTQTPEFSESSDSSASEVTQSQSLPTPTVTVDDFFNQPTIGSQLLLPPGQDGVQLLLAPAPDANPRAVPLETQFALPGGLEGERQTSLAPISSQRFLPAATEPVGLLPAAQETSANPLAIAIENEQWRIDNGKLRMENTGSAAPTAAGQSSPQAQVGRTLARTSQASALPRSTPALLPASTAPRSPLSSQTLAFAARDAALSAPIETLAQGTSGTAKVNDRNAATPPSPKPSPSPASRMPAPSVLNPTPTLQTEPDVAPDSGSVASRELGVAIAAPETPSLWESWKNQIGIALGALVILILAWMRWAMGGGQAPLEEETDWDHLPRSKSRTIDQPAPLPAPSLPAPLKHKRVSEEFLQFIESGGLAPLRDLPVPIVLPPKSTRTAEKPSRTLASSALLERKPRQRNGMLPWEDPDQSPEAHFGANAGTKSSPKEKPARPFGIASVDMGIWIPIVLISLIGLGAWLIQFYGWFSL